MPWWKENLLSSPTSQSRNIYLLYELYVIADYDASEYALRR